MQLGPFVCPYFVQALLSRTDNLLKTTNEDLRAATIPVTKIVLFLLFHLPILFRLPRFYCQNCHIFFYFLTFSSTVWPRKQSLFPFLSFNAISLPFTVSVYFCLISVLCVVQWEPFSWVPSFVSVFCACVCLCGCFCACACVVYALCVHASGYITHYEHASSEEPSP